MTSYTLAVNSGSSSLKLKLFQNSPTEQPKPIATIKASGLNTDKVEFSFEPKINSDPQPKDISTLQDAFNYSLQQIKSKLQLPDLEDKGALAVAHRVVHGGDFKHEAVINSDTLHELERLESLAPL
jgi:acetate kinase